MDELSMIQRLLDEDPPSPEVVARGRARLFGAPAPARRASVHRVLAFGLTGAVATAVLVLWAFVSGTGTPSPGGGGPLVGNGSAQSVLLAAAVRAESARTSGTYWHVRSLSRATLPHRFGHGQNHYTLERLTVTETWTTHAGRTLLGRREWVRPKTAQDEAAWKRDGAPTRWCSGQTDTDPPQPICLRVAPGTASVTRFGPDRFQVTEGHNLTFGQLQRLPQDAGALRAWLAGIARYDLDRSASTAVVNMNVESELCDLLVDSPVPPGVRAAAFRALAGMPRVTSTGPTHDELGRPGLGISIRPGVHGVLVLAGGGAVAARPGEITRTLIIDPQTSHILADQMTIGHGPEPTVDTLILDVGWTNQKPHTPAFPSALPPAGKESSA